MEEEKEEYNFKAGVWWLVVILFILLCIACRSVKYVPVETVKTEVKYRDKLLRDSIHVQDSIFLFVKGDTVFRDRWHTEYRDRIKQDTVYICKTDSFGVPYPVEKQLTRWEHLKMDMGGIAIGSLLFVCLAIIGWIGYKLRRKN